MTASLEMRRVSSVLEVQGSLRAPVDTDLCNDVAHLLARGDRRIILNLSRVSDVDAAGVGELVRALNLTRASGGELLIAGATERVNELLQVTGLSVLLNR